MKKPWLLALGSLLSGGAIAGDAKPPATFSDRGACPFECCSYREWRVEAATPLLRGRSSNSGVVRSLTPGSRVDGVTGVVDVTRPGRIRVGAPYLSGTSGVRYRKGDIVYVYTPLGEGFFKVWFGGKMYEEEASFMHDGIDGFDACVEEGSCWGKQLAFPEYVWWVKVKASDGTTGWSKRPGDFGDMDACG